MDKTIGGVTSGEYSGWSFISALFLHRNPQISEIIRVCEVFVSFFYDWLFFETSPKLKVYDNGKHFWWIV